MSKLKKFESFRLMQESCLLIKGGDTCSDCVHSAFIACNASCGGGACNVGECINNQTNQCLTQPYCQGFGG